MKALLPILLFMTLPLAACGMFRKPAVDVLIYNRSSEELNEAQVKFGKYLCKWGVVIPSTSAGFMHYPHPITPDAEMSWDDVKGHQIRKLDLRKIYPPKKSRQLTFLVYDDRVEVKFTERK